MANEKMGFEGQLLYGPAGDVATLVLTNVKDITLDMNVERGDTTIRGDSSVPPIKTSAVTARMLNIEFTMLRNVGDSEFTALMVAAAAGTDVALKGRDYSGGLGPEGDYNLKVSLPWLLNGEQVVTFTAEPSISSGRTPKTNV